jgi:hypothetical protein
MKFDNGMTEIKDAAPDPGAASFIHCKIFREYSRDYHRIQPINGDGGNSQLAS